MVNDFENVRAHLESERKRLTQELGLLRSQGIEEKLDSSFGKREEAATRSFELEKRLAYIKRTAEQLVEVERALEKLGKGTYGLCDCCGKPIPPARLEALPQTNFCLDCKVKRYKSPTRGTN